VDATVRHYLKPLRKRCNWHRPWGGAAAAGAVGWWLWHAGEGGGLPALAATACWLTAAHWFSAGVPRWRFARDVSRVRRKAAIPIPTLEHYRAELLGEGVSPQVAERLAEQRRLMAEMARGAAQRRLVLLEAGIVVPDRWKEDEA